MMRDVFDEEAFEGLNRLTGEELESDMTSLFQQLDNRLQPGKKRQLLLFYRIAAALILLIGIGTILVLVIKTPKPVVVTQDIHKEEKVSRPEVYTPSETEKPNQEMESNSRSKDRKDNTPSSVNAETEFKAEDAEISVSTDSLSYATGSNTAISKKSSLKPRLSKEKSGKLFDDKDSGSGFYITGRVLGVDNNALAGVSVMEKGARGGTLTDMNGNFELLVKDTGNKLTINHIGYEQTEVLPGEVAGKDITLNEDEVALNEIVVLGYQASPKSRAEKTSAGSEKDSAVTRYFAPYNYTKPVPPDGSLQLFEKWVENHLDLSKFKELDPGYYKIEVKIHVHTDGSLKDVTVNNKIPEVVAEEYKRVVLQSPLWKPALMDDMPVEAEVMIIFSLTIEYRDP
jgi:hypothetical protein